VAQNSYLMTVPQQQQQIDSAYLPGSIVLSSTLTLGVAGFAAKWMFGQLVGHWQRQFEEVKSEIHVVNGRCESLNTKLSDMEARLAKEYVSMEQFVRTSMALEAKIDRLADSMSNKFDRILDKIEEKR
jgi:septal ring factor EnvC (AmiA/AmiB activator)